MTKRTHKEIRNWSRGSDPDDYQEALDCADEIIEQLLAEAEAWEKAALSHGTAQTLAIEEARKLKGGNNG